MNRKHVLGRNRLENEMRCIFQVFCIQSLCIRQSKFLRMFLGIGIHYFYCKNISISNLIFLLPPNILFFSSSHTKLCTTTTTAQAFSNQTRPWRASGSHIKKWLSIVVQRLSFFIERHFFVRAIFSPHFLFAASTHLHHKIPHCLHHFLLFVS